MGAVYTNRLIIIATSDIYFYSRFTSRKGTNLATYIQNRDSQYEFIETYDDKRCSETSKATAIIGAFKDTPWLQVACTVSLYNTAIIGRYEATKNY